MRHTILSKHQAIILDIEPKLFRKKMHQLIDTDSFMKLDLFQKKIYQGIVTKYDFEYQKKTRYSLVKVYGSYKSYQSGRTKVNLDIDPGFGVKTGLIINFLIILGLIIAGIMKSQFFLLIGALLPTLIFTLNFLKLKREIKNYDFESVLKNCEGNA